MKLSGYICLTLLVLSLVTQGSSLELFSMAVGGMLAIGLQFTVNLVELIGCVDKPCCNSRWIPADLTALRYSLTWKLHGQHLASWMVLQHIESHILSENPSKALVLSFHGPVGVGKTFVSQIIAEDMYAEGLRSKFVHIISAVRDFPDERKLAVYKNQLRAWIEGNLTACDRSMFIIEEVDKLPAGLLDVLVPFVEYRSNTQRIKYSKAIFIFLSNTGSSDIMRATFDHRKSGKDRETIDQSELKNIIIQAIKEDNEDGLWYSQLISSQLITAYIPFLPLEKTHIRKCIIDSLISKKYFSNARDITSELVDKIMKELTFYPATEQVLSTTGCKRVVEKIDYVMVD